MSRYFSNPISLDGLLAPPPLGRPYARESTPPPTASPLPRTPKPQRFLSPPKTPAPGLTSSFGPEEHDLSFNYDLGMSIPRPSSALSTASQDSNSSVDSNTTYATNATSVGDDRDGEHDYTPQDSMKKGKARQVEYLGQETPGPVAKAVKPRTIWTEEMDAHLWRTYALYQTDPKITPFFVAPGQVPPLGVCHKVAREARRSWKEGKLNGTYRSALLQTPRPRTRRAVSSSVVEPSNRGDAMRKVSPYSFPASESSARRRLRELCRQNYGPSRKPYHFHQHGQRAKTPSSKLREATVSPSPTQYRHFAPTPRDPFATSSTRSMALSLATSTASSMTPSGVLASITAGRDISIDSVAAASTSSTAHGEFTFSSITERIQSAMTPSATTSTTTPPATISPAALSLASIFETTPTTSSSTNHSPGHSRRKSMPANPLPRSLLPPLELKSSKSPYGTWPRRLKRGESSVDDNETTNTPLPPQRRKLRGTLNDLFGESVDTATTPIPRTEPMKTRSRTRGHTISAGTNPLSTGAMKRRVRPSAPLLTVTGPVCYDSPARGEDGSSPLGKRERIMADGEVIGGFVGKGEGEGESGEEEGDYELPRMRRRLGSPFAF